MRTARASRLVAAAGLVRAVRAKLGPRMAVTLFLLALSLSPGGATDVVGRIRFSAGASSASVDGRLDNVPRKNNLSNGNDRWILTARRGQTLTVNVQASSNVSIVVWQGDYRSGLLTTGTGPSVSKSVSLPVNGDYNIEISADTKPITYSLQVQII